MGNPGCNECTGDPSAGIPKWRWRWFVCLLLAIYLFRGLMLICIIPPLEMWDEYQHVGYIVYLHDTGKLPILNRTLVPEALMREVVRWPQSQYTMQRLAPSGALAYEQYWSSSAPPRLDLQWSATHPLLYEAQQPPVYHWLMWPIYRMAGGTENLGRAVSVLRLVNLGISAVGLAIMLGWLGSVFQDRRYAMIAGLWIVTQPLLLLNAVRVANDALAVTLGTAIVVWSIALCGRRLIWHGAGLGALLGLSILTKPTDVALVPLVMCALALLAVRGKVGWSRAVAAGAVLLIATTLETAAYFHFTWRQYGMLIPMQGAVINHSKGVRLGAYLDWFRPSHLAFWRYYLQDWFVQDGLWVGGWSFISAPAILTWIYGKIMLMAVVGFALPWLFRLENRWHPFVIFKAGATVPLAIVLCMCVLAGMVFHAVESMVATGICRTNPWYAALAIPWFLALLTAGAIGWRNSRVGYGLALFVPGFFVLTEMFCTWWRMVPEYSQKTIGRAALGRLASLHPPSMGAETLLIATGATLALFGVAMSLCGRSLKSPRPQTNNG